MKSSLFESYDMNGIRLKNRVAMAPMTRSRAVNNLPDDLVAEYYAQRSEAGLIITEGVSPSPNGLGYARIPALYNEDHVNAWRKTTTRVHADGSKVFMQMMHTGRVSHEANMPSGSKILAPSNVRLEGEIWTDTEGMRPYSVPHEMTESEIQKTINEFEHSAELAIKAGFDGVEIHGANGYLIDQFLNLATNRRSDHWGGSVENRARFALDIAKRLAITIGREKVGIRLSPFGVFNNMSIDENMEDTFIYLADSLNKIGISYLHLVDHSSMGAPAISEDFKLRLRKHFGKTFILSGGYDKARALNDLDADRGDLKIGRAHV